jgi:hypothetical protein
MHLRHIKAELGVEVPQLGYGNTYFDAWYSLHSPTVFILASGPFL